MSHVTSLHDVNIVYSELLLTNQHGFVAFVFLVQSEAFLPVQLQKYIITHLSMGGNVLTLNRYMISKRK